MYNLDSLGANQQVKRGKLITDAIYGLITVENCYIPIINCQEFQRLRQIKQGSLFYVFPTAVHDRFSHSLGAMHVGQKMIGLFLASGEFCFKSPKEINQKNQGESPTIKRYKSQIAKAWLKLKNDGELARLVNVFTLSCLLHDIAHAPFSHTTEEIFIRNTAKWDKLNEELKNCGIYSDPSIDYENRVKRHETMSAWWLQQSDSEIHKLLLQIDAYAGYYKNKNERQGNRTISIEDIRWIGRMITGIQSPPNRNDTLVNLLKTQLYNCAVTMLNSDYIDADKLDYLARDMYHSGFANMEIDFDRVIDGITLCYDADPKIASVNDLVLTIKYGFSRRAMGRIENVDLAKKQQIRLCHRQHVALYFNETMIFAIDAALTSFERLLDPTEIESIAENQGDHSDFIAKILYDPCNVFSPHFRAFRLSTVAKNALNFDMLQLPPGPLSDNSIYYMFDLFLFIWQKLENESTRREVFGFNRSEASVKDAAFHRAEQAAIYIKQLLSRQHYYTLWKSEKELFAYIGVPILEKLKEQSTVPMTTVLGCAGVASSSDSSSAPTPDTQMFKKLEILRDVFTRMHKNVEFASRKSLQVIEATCVALPSIQGVYRSNIINSLSELVVSVQKMILDGSFNSSSLADSLARFESVIRVEGNITKDGIMKTTTMTELCSRSASIQASPSLYTALALVQFAVLVGSKRLRNKKSVETIHPIWESVLMHRFRLIDTEPEYSNYAPTIKYKERETVPIQIRNRIVSLPEVNNASLFYIYITEKPLERGKKSALYDLLCDSLLEYE